MTKKCSLKTIFFTHFLVLLEKIGVIVGRRQARRRRFEKK
jgi:hypothetical protein